VKRKAISRDALDVVALYLLKRGDGSFVITREETKNMEPEEIKALFRSRVQVEHMVPHALTQDDHPSNLQFLAPADHKPKTARDVKAIAKSKRIAKKEAEFRRRLLAKSADDAENTQPIRRKAKIPSRPFAKAPEGHKWFRSKNRP